MVFISDMQKKVLFLVDNMINEDKSFNEISNELYNQNYHFMVETKNGYTSKTHFKIYKTINGKEEYSFVDLIKRKNGLAYWETIRLS